MSIPAPLPPARSPEHAGSPFPAELAALRRRIAELEGRPAGITPDSEAGWTAWPWMLGVDALDRALPETGLAPDGLHEAGGTADADGPAAAAFLAALLIRLSRAGRRGTVLVCQSRNGAARFGRIHGPGWRDLGLDPADLLVLYARRDRDVSWAAEEGLRCGALAAVLAEVESIGFTASRRLSLAASEGRTSALLLRHDGLGPASVAHTRWRVTTLPGGVDPFDRTAPGPPRWRLDLARCRGGHPATHDVEWNRETGDFRVAAAMADRPPAPVTVPRRSQSRAAG